MAFVAILDWDANNRVTKYALFDSRAEAQAHVDQFIGPYPRAFAAVEPADGNSFTWLVNPSGNVLAVAPRPVPPRPFNIARIINQLTEAEADAFLDNIVAAGVITEARKLEIKGG